MTDLDIQSFSNSLSRRPKGKEVLSILLHLCNGPALHLSPASHQAILVLLISFRRNPTQVIDSIKTSLKS